MPYYTTTNLMGHTIIIRLDGDTMTSFMDPSPGNADWQAYEEWLAEGNTPEPWPPVE